jgi:hypothetical protein
MKSILFTCVLLAFLGGGVAAAVDPAGEALVRSAGRPEVAAGERLGYWVWHEGDRWSVRWTTLGAMRSFAGSIEAEGGDLRNLDRVDVERRSQVVRSGRPGRSWVGPRGRVHVRPGVAPVVATHEQDKIDKDGDQRIVWDSKTDLDVDGFDFTVGRHVTGLRFTLRLDGRTWATDVALGKEGNAPAANPFRVDLVATD